MFTKITRVNRKGHEVETLINVDHITGITEIEREPITYYDDNGEVAKTEEQESLFEVRFDNYRNIYLSKASYEELVKKLTK